MEETFILTTTTQWKALSHPLRANILRILTERAHTNEELADLLDVDSGKLYFHTKNLLDAGLIEMTETRSKGPITEKVYRAIARAFIANELPDTESNDTGAPTFDYLLSTMQMLYRQSWRDSEAMVQGAHYAYHLTHQIPSDRVHEFVGKLKVLVEDFQDMRTDDPKAPKYSFGLLLHSVPETQPKKK